MVRARGAGRYDVRRDDGTPMEAKVVERRLRFHRHEPRWKVGDRVDVRGKRDGTW